MNSKDLEFFWCESEGGAFQDDQVQDNQVQAFDFQTFTSD